MQAPGPEGEKTEPPDAELDRRTARPPHLHPVRQPRSEVHAREPAVHIRPEPDRRVVDPAGRRNRITGINLRVRRKPAPRQIRRGNENHGRAQERSIPPGDHQTAANEGNELGGPEPADERVSPRDSHGHQQKAAGQPPPQAPPTLPRQQLLPQTDAGTPGHRRQTTDPTQSENLIAHANELTGATPAGPARRPSTHTRIPPHMHARLEKYARTFADRLIETLKAGVAPWRRYRGNNAVLLLATALTRGYGDMRWAGFGQIRRAGGMVRKTVWNDRLAIVSSS